MKTETILNKLLKLKENPYNAELLDSIINELKIDVYNENMGLKNGMKLIELNSDSYKCFFDADNLKKICDILGTTELVMRLYGELKPALIIDKKTDNQAVITPVRSYC